MLLAAILFIKRMADVTRIRPWVTSEEMVSDDNGRLKKIPENTQVYEIDGPMFFANSDKLASISIRDDVKVVVLRMRSVTALDVSALRSVKALWKKCRSKDITVIFSHVNKQPMKVIKKAGFYEQVGEENFAKNIDVALSKASKIVK